MTELRRDPESLGRRTWWKMFDITGVISLSNILLSKLYSLSSGSAVCLITCRNLVLCLFLACLERREAGVYMHGTLVRPRACDLEAARPSYDTDIIDARNRFLENANRCKKGFVRIGEVQPSRIPMMVWQTSSGHGSNYMMQ